MTIIFDYFSDASQTDSPGCLRWVDLAATDADKAMDFYQGLFGWRTMDQQAGDGIYHVLKHPTGEFASIYQLRKDLVKEGIPSHWTPYVTVESLEVA